jgi:hypothetical protein
MRPGAEDGEGRHVSTHDVSREGRLWRTVMRRMAQIPLSGDRREPAQSIKRSRGSRRNGPVTHRSPDTSLKREGGRWRGAV